MENYLMIEKEKLRTLLEIITSLRTQIYQLEGIVRELRNKNLEVPCKELT